MSEGITGDEVSWGQEPRARGQTRVGFSRAGLTL